MPEIVDANIPKLSDKLKNTLLQNRTIWNRLNLLLKSVLKPADIKLIRSISKGANSLVNNDRRLTGELDNFCRFLELIAQYGSTCPVNTVSALILSGAAIAMPNIPLLRQDLDISIRDARQSYQNQTRGGTVSSSGGQYLGDPFVQDLVNIYSTLCKNMNMNGKLAAAIKGLITDSSKPLRVGFSMNTLKLSEIQKQCDNFFRGNTKHQTNGGVQPGNKQDVRESTAPSKFQLKIPHFFCHETNENGGDQIFWVAYFSRITNLDIVYSKIDAAISGGSISELELVLRSDIQYTFEKNKSEPLPGCVVRPQYYDLRTKPGDFGFGPYDIVEGFFPWSCCISCFEDDDQEYDAVNEVVDQVGDTADLISKGASVVAACSGPTVVSAGASIVASLAGVVSLGCDITEGIVDIVNYFDNDDYLGRINLPLPDSVDFGGDYLERPIVTVPDFSIETEATDGTSKGTYSIQTQEYLLPPLKEHIIRNWRVLHEAVIDKEEEHAGILGCGNSGDSPYKLSFSQQMISAPGVPIVTDGVQKLSSYGHAEWKDGLLPQLKNNNTYCEGDIHWGVNANHTVKFKAGVNVYKFLKHL